MFWDVFERVRKPHEKILINLSRCNVNLLSIEWNQFANENLLCSKCPCVMSWVFGGHSPISRINDNCIIDTARAVSLNYALCSFQEAVWLLIWNDKKKVGIHQLCDLLRDLVLVRKLYFGIGRPSLAFDFFLPSEMYDNIQMDVLICLYLCVQCVCVRACASLCGTIAYEYNL